MRYILLLLTVLTSIAEAKKYGLDADRTVVETYPRTDNTDQDWWVSSGAYFYVHGGIGSTIQGDLPALDRFAFLYLKSNPVDTDQGAHPQNIFRLETNSVWIDYVQTMYFRIKKINLSTSLNRNESNGILFFIRELDQNHLYYAGVRVDGTAVIKKKNGGLDFYTTMDQKRTYADGKTYDATIPAQSNFIPMNTWIGLRSEIRTIEDGKVSIRLWLDKDAVNHWDLVAEAIDDGTQNGAVFAEAGEGGIRTDFMDVEFHSYKVKDLSENKK